MGLGSRAPVHHAAVPDPAAGRGDRERAGLPPAAAAPRARSAAGGRLPGREPAGAVRRGRAVTSVGQVPSAGPPAAVAEAVPRVVTGTGAELLARFPPRLVPSSWPATCARSEEHTSELQSQF